MKRSDLIRELAKETNLSNESAKEVITVLTNIIIRQLASGDTVTIDNLGRFFTVIYRDHNIKSLDGSEINIEARQSPRFIPSKKMKEAVKKAT